MAVAATPISFPDDVVEVLPVPVAVVARGSGRLLAQNAAARRCRWAFAVDLDDGGVLVDDHGDALPAERLPARRAAAGEALRDERTLWRTADGLACLCITSVDHGDERVILCAVDVSETWALQRDLVQRDNLFSFVAHELRTPIHALMLLIDRLRRPRSGPISTEELARTTEPLHRQGERLTRLVQNLLDMGRIQSGRFDLAREELDLAEMMRELEPAFRAQAAMSGSSLVVDADDAVTGCWDRTRLEQLVDNLVSNAIKYGQGGPIEIKVQQVDGNAALVVKDSGIGIDAAVLPRIFLPFQRGTDLAAGQSLGVGLFIAHEVVRAHGGRIEVASRPGHGSTFRVILPVGCDEVVTDGGADGDGGGR